MNTIKKEDIKQEVFDLYDDYAHNRVNRREFVQKLSTYAVGGLTVASLMSFLMPDYRASVMVKANDPGLKWEYIHYQSPNGDGDTKALLSMPGDAKKKLGGFVVVHENRGLNPYIEDVARRRHLQDLLPLHLIRLHRLGVIPETTTQDVRCKANLTKIKYWKIL
jgi:carboxymethylenebutenolidase